MEVRMLVHERLLVYCGLCIIIIIIIIKIKYHDFLPTARRVVMSSQTTCRHYTTLDCRVDPRFHVPWTSHNFTFTYMHSQFPSLLYSTKLINQPAQLFLWICHQYRPLVWVCLYIYIKCFPIHSNFSPNPQHSSMHITLEFRFKCWINYS